MRAPSTPQPPGAHVLAWLEAEGRLSPFDEESVLHHAARAGERVEEALVECGHFEEAELLKLLAARYQTRFVTTERLAKADIDPSVLARIPRKLAERLQVFPVLFDGQSLSFVVAAPGEDDVEKQVQVVTGAREVRAFVALPSAIRAAIAKFYGGERHAFAPRSAREVPELDAHFDALPGLDELSPAAPPKSAPTGVDPESYLETLNVLVALLEQARPALRGHASRVAQVCRRLAERVGLSASDRHALLVAAYLHDLGKGSPGYHLTALNVARFEGHRAQASKHRDMPVKLFASAALPEATQRALLHLYERFDGQGFPDGLAGKDIPYGARVLAIVETYCDLIGSAHNPYRAVLSVPQALAVVKELSGTLFDPTLAELLRHAVLGEAQTEGVRRRALLVDPDPEETTVLELRLLEHGFAVVVARDLASARAALADPPDVVVTEVDLDAPGDGFALLTALDALDEARRPALMFVTDRADRESVSRGFDLGAADYVLKPASAELVATKVGQVVGAARTRTDGVSGSLREMSLPDVVQVLANGRKTGRLSVVSSAKRGEIHFFEGQIHDARCGPRTGEDAFYALLELQEGTFSLDPTFVPESRVIHASAEGLLLEGMRRMDEGLL